MENTIRIDLVRSTIKTFRDMIVDDSKFPYDDTEAFKRNTIFKMDSLVKLCDEWERIANLIK